MRARRGFTLIELLVAIVLAGVVALLVYGAAGAAIDTQERLAADRAVVQTDAALRAVISDALRNARPGTRYGDTAFAVENGVTSSGRPADRLSFLTAGGTPPITNDVDWRVTLELTGDGLALIGVPLGVSDPVPTTVHVPGVTALDVRVLTTAGGRWVSDGVTLPRVPAGIEITYERDGDVIGRSLRIALPWSAGR
jgi:prepilin-type N-terminal cleavage/methylation domain-containing protein